MSYRSAWLLVLFGVLPILPAFGQEEPVPGQRSAFRFAQSPIQSSDADQVRMRVSAVEQPPAYDVANEEFEILLPADYDAREPHGLFIWISPGKAPSIPVAWEAELAERDLIFIGAKNAGNQRNIFDRFRLAIDANVNLRERYAIDGRRVYVSGFSGGGRVASMLGVAWAEMFSGTLCFMGVNFYTDLLAEDGKVYTRYFQPDDQILGLAKQYCRYALVTGEKDFNRANTRAAFAEGFEKEGFKAVKLFEVPELGHKLPSADWLGQALDYVDEGKR